MNNSTLLTILYSFERNPAYAFILGCALIFLFQLQIFSQTQISTSPDEKTLIVEDAPEMEVFAFGKSVIVRNRAKGVFAFGGDVVVEGRVEGDVATIGGSIIQKDGAYIGGNIIAFGGSYRPESQSPLREPGRKTIMFAVFEEELRGLAEDPRQIFSPPVSTIYFAQRLLSILFWLIVSLAITTIAPGAVSRAVARLQLSTLRVVGIGFATFLLIVICVIAGLRVLPDYVSAILGIMALFLLMLAYVFGRVAVQASVGKLFQKHVLRDRNRSESLAMFMGVVAWTILLSIPYLWIFALFVVFAVGIGLAATARRRPEWQTE